MDASDLIIIGGSPRSGTSLVQKILGFHSEIYAGPEFDNLLSLTHLLQGIRRSSEAGRIEPFIKSEELDKVGREIVDKFLMQPKIKANKPFLSEKTPENVIGFDIMSREFENAKFIWVARDPRAVLASLKKVRERMTEKATPDVGFASSLTNDIKNVRKYMHAGYEFYRQNKPKCHLVKYEDLVLSPEIEAKEICAFLGVEFEENMLRTDRVNDISRQLSESTEWYSKEMYDREVHKDSMEKWKGKLSDQELQEIGTAFQGDQACSLLGYTFEFKERSLISKLVDELIRKSKNHK